MMSEIEKLKAGLDYCYDDEEVVAVKNNAVLQCEKYNNIHPLDREKRIIQLKKNVRTSG